MDQPRVTLCGLARRALHAIELWLFLPRCKLGCGERTSNLEAHTKIHHAGDWIEDKR